jgi:hypothetical protein
VGGPALAQALERRRLTVARGGARSAAQAQGSLGACTRQGVKRGSSPEGCVGGERAELGQRGGEQWLSSELGVVAAPARDRQQLVSAPQSVASARKNDGAHTAAASVRREADGGWQAVRVERHLGRSCRLGSMELADVAEANSAALSSGGL